jgi:hypothetical protein
MRFWAETKNGHGFPLDRRTGRACEPDSSGSQEQILGTSAKIRSRKKGCMATRTTHGSGESAINF